MIKTNLGKSIQFYLGRSMLFHVAILALSFIGGKVAYESTKLIRQRNMELVQASVRVDMVAMPKYTLNELKNTSSGVEEAKPQEPTPVETKVEELSKEEAKVEEKVAPKEEVNVEKETAPVFEKAETKKAKRKDFLSKLKQIGNKKVKSAGIQKEDKGLLGAKTTQLKQLVLAGNKLSKGVQIFGDNRAGDMTAFQAYAAKIPEYVRPKWKLPSFLIDKKLKCRVRVWIALSGEVFRTEVYETSGDKEFDQRAIEAIQAASPLPRQTQEFAQRGIDGDIVLGFPL